MGGFAAQALADGVVTVDELHEAQQLTVDCLKSRGIEAEYHEDLTLEVIQPTGASEEEVSSDADECQEDAGGPVVGAFVAQTGPSEDEIRDQLVGCLQENGLIGSSPSPAEIDEALSTPEGFNCIPGVTPVPEGSDSLSTEP